MHLRETKRNGNASPWKLATTCFGFTAFTSIGFKCVLRATMREQPIHNLQPNRRVFLPMRSTIAIAVWWCFRGFTVRQPIMARVDIGNKTHSNPVQHRFRRNQLTVVVCTNKGKCGNANSSVIVASNCAETRDCVCLTSWWTDCWCVNSVIRFADLELRTKRQEGEDGEKLVEGSVCRFLKEDWEGWGFWQGRKLDLWQWRRLDSFGHEERWRRWSYWRRRLVSTKNPQNEAWGVYIEHSS